jgi:hypothetical protein
MISTELEYLDGIAAGAWILNELKGNPNTVGNLVPGRYPAFGRIFHPAFDNGGKPVAWCEVAASTGRSVYPAMQWAVVSKAIDAGVGVKDWEGSPPESGPMDPEWFGRLGRVLGASSGLNTPCCFGVWTGWTWQRLHFGGRAPESSKGRLPSSVDSADRPIGPPWRSESATLEIGDRPYVVLGGPISAVLPTSTSGKAGPLSRISPDLCWAADRSWFVYADVELDSTLVGGSKHLIESLVVGSELEALYVTKESVIV